ncbi:DUF4882 family protein [Acinetobacter colistiniresistens]|nr:DUF4882 family protein [Acinetobacter colistiniresistens]
MLTGSTFAACSYDLDASLQDIKSWQTSSNSRFPNYPRSFELIPNINQVNQKVSGSITLLSNIPVDHYATSKKLANFKAQYPFTDRVPSNLPFIDKPVSTTGIVGLESIIDITSLNIDMGTVKDSYEFGYSLMGSSQQKLELGLDIVYGKYNNTTVYADGDYIHVTGGSLKPDGNGFTTLKEVERKTHKITIPADGKIKVGIYINQSTQQVGYIINGINYGYLNINLQNAITSLGYSAGINQNNNTGSLLIGKSVGLQLITDHSNMQLTYPTGAKDICGNTI